jgi:hypothetical protein
MGVVHAAVGGGATRNETAIRSIAKVYAAALLPYGLFLMGQGIWILLTRTFRSLRLKILARLELG